MKNPRLLLGMPHRETLYVSGGTTLKRAETLVGLKGYVTITEMLTRLGH